MIDRGSYAIEPLRTANGGKLN